MALTADYNIAGLGYLIAEPASLIYCVSDEAPLRSYHADECLAHRTCVDTDLELKARDLFDGFLCKPNALWNVATQIACHVRSAQRLHAVKAILTREGI